MINEFLEFLKARYLALYHTRTQIEYQNLTPEKEREADIVLRGRMNEINRIIRKLKTSTLPRMINKENFSINLTLRKKLRHQLAAKGNIMGTPKTNTDKMPLHKVEGIELLDVSLVERKNCVDHHCLIDQSPENLWAWYSDVKDEIISSAFKINFLEDLIKKFLDKSTATKEKTNET